jgi:hypothetical protein
MINDIFNWDLTRLRIKSHRWCSGRFYTICYNQNAPRALKTRVEIQNPNQLKWNFDEFADMHIEKFGYRLFCQSAEEARIGAQSIIVHFGFSCLLAGGRLRFSIPKSKENKAIGIIVDTYTGKSIFPSFREAI